MKLVKLLLIMPIVSIGCVVLGAEKPNVILSGYFDRPAQIPTAFQQNAPFFYEIVFIKPQYNEKAVIEQYNQLDEAQKDDLNKLFSALEAPHIYQSDAMKPKPKISIKKLKELHILVDPDWVQINAQDYPEQPVGWKERVSDWWYAKKQ